MATKKQKTRKKSNKTILGLPRFSVRTYLLVVVLLVLVGLGYILLSQASPGWTLVYSEDFNGTSLNTADWTTKTGTESHHQGYYLPANVSVHDGKLDLLSQRNCVTSGQKPSAANARTDGSVCPSGTTTMYSSGKVTSTKKWPSGRIDIVAQLPSTQQGLWSALWMRGPGSWGSSGPSTDYGELDILEWYGDRPTTRTATTIFSHTATNAAKPYYTHHDKNVGYDLSLAPHTYSMEWSSDGIKYYFDNTIVNSSPDVGTNNGITAALFNQIMTESPWELRMETEITKPGSYDKAPDNAAIWKPSHFLIDSVKVYAPATGTSVTTKPTIAPTSTATSKPTITSTITPTPTIKPTSTSTSTPKDTTVTVVTTPQNFKVKAGNGQAVLSWTAVGVATEYSVRWISSDSNTKSNGSTWDYAINHGPNPTTGMYTVTGLKNGKSYDFQVATKTATAKSSYTATVSATPTGPVADVQSPKGLSSLSSWIGFDLLQAKWSVNLSWPVATDDTGVVGYQIMRNNVLSSIIPAGTTKFSDFNVVQNGSASYKYQVKAFDAAGNAVFSPVSTFTMDCSWINLFAKGSWCVKN